MDNQEVVRVLAAMTEVEFQDTITEARGEDNPTALKDRAAQALREYRRPSSKENG